MADPIIKRALLSVTDKTGITEFASALVKEFGVEIISTGGTARVLEEAGISVTSIDAVTEFPEMMDGRVKTLHPRVHGGLLARRDLESHMSEAKEHGIEMIDMVVVNLYEFQKTVASGADFAECIENIDIGGPSMLRSAAKNLAILRSMMQCSRRCALTMARPPMKRALSSRSMCSTPPRNTMALSLPGSRKRSTLQSYSPR